MTTEKLKRIWKEAAMAQLRYCPGLREKYEKQQSR
jgi:hypothetical protein